MLFFISFLMIKVIFQMNELEIFLLLKTVLVEAHKKNVLVEAHKKN